MIKFCTLIFTLTLGLMVFSPMLKAKVDGNRMIVGAPNYSLNTIVHGAVYVFDCDGSNWNETQILTPFDGNNGDQFEFSVSLSGTRLLIGANKDDDASTDVVWCLSMTLIG